MSAGVKSIDMKAITDRIRTLQRGFLFQDGGVLTDANGRSANIIASDIPAANGVIHVIDRVVLP